ncbi:glycosyltransferase family protein [Pelosinus propionicus]|uniref:Uncharacterized protein n=1 Tax=Pelosinus propionicus DSM 13327 TaxID=1123291 RepID=A0A1I4HSG5_9FIRM|nr:hypothetical protein [Pelosinus propionicus]SFL45092.1 hypothetical protein SAMN04490355_100510 [Pelosinus propionicus DSM 13327]
MEKILLVLVGKIKKRDRFSKLLHEFEQEGYAVHLFEDENPASFGLDTLESAVGYLQHHYGGFESITVMGNNKSLLFAWYRMKHSTIKEYLLYVEEAIGTEDMIVNEDKEKIIALNDFSDLQITDGMKSIKIIFEDWDHIVSLIANYILYIAPYKNEKITASLHDDAPTGWDDILESKLFQDIITYLHGKYSLSIGILSIILVPFVYHKMKNSDILDCLLYNAAEEYGRLDFNTRIKVIDYIEDLFPYFTPQCQVCLLSLLYESTHEKKYILQMLDKKLCNKLTIQEKSATFWKIKSMLFVGKLELTIDELIIFKHFYQVCVDEIVQQVQLPKTKPVVLRNRDRIVIITSQFLGIEHAPTRNVLDYSHNLKKMGKEVFIINSADISFPLYEPLKAKPIESYNTFNYIEIDNENYPFYQSKAEMPNFQDMQKIIDLVDDFNPEFVIAVGDSTLAADVCSHFIDVITIPCGGILPIYPKTYWAVPRKPLPSDEQVFQAFSMAKERIFSIHYTFMKKEKETQLVRRDLELPEDAFILCVVGNRLDVEVTEIFITELEDILREVPQSYILFVGVYPNYNEVMLKHSLLKQRSHYAGRRSDIQSIYPLCNAYLNPLRQGGATSGAEAMLEGIPIITKPHGDVYYQLWLEQSFTDTADIITFLQRCIADPVFYLKQCNHAKALGEKLFNTAGMMQEVLSYMGNYLRIVKERAND